MILNNYKNMYIIKFLIYPMLIFVCLISCFSNNYFISWALMEFSFLCLISIQMLSNLKYVSFFQYYILNFFSSSLMLLSLVMLYNILIFNDYFVIIKFMFYISLMLKLGMFPFTNWMIKYLFNSTWMEIFIFSVLLKFIIFNIYYLFMNKDCILFNFMMLISMLYSSISAVNINYYKQIMSYSSICHSMIMLYLLGLSYDMFIIYYIIYYMTSYIFMFMMDLFNMESKIDSKTFMNLKFKFMFIFSMFSYSGFPPFLSFLMKWGFIQSFSLSMLDKIFIYTMLLMSLIMIWNYINMMNNQFLSFKIIELLNIQLNVFKLLFEFFFFFFLTLMIMFIIYIYF